MSVPRAVAVTLCLALLGTVLLAALLARSSLPRVSGVVQALGLEGPVEVTFDEWQRPYVAAQSLADALQVQGWLHASNRLWQMELMRRAGSGRLAELLASTMLPTDREIWRMGVPQLAGRLESNTSPESLALIDRYVMGVNQSIAGMRVLPPEFLMLRAERPRWTRDDVFAVGALMALQSANNMDNELVRLALATVVDAKRFDVFMAASAPGADYPFVLPGSTKTANLLHAADRLAALDASNNPLMPRLGFGSNGWVVSAGRSATGHPLFAFDSHDELGLPNLFYEVHLFPSGDTQVRGWSVPGMPGVINGYNERIAWGFTNIGDTQDLFIEQRAAHDLLLFKNGDKWLRATVESVRIPVRDGPTETLDIVHTHNGPLINDDPPISLAWTVHRIEQPNLDSLLQLNRARDWLSFSAALDGLPAPTLNVTYADVSGTIAFRSGGVLPRRAFGDGLRPTDGSDPSRQWLGLVEPQDMPNRVNPSNGFLAAANARVNPPGQGALVSADNAAPYRIARITQALEGRQRWNTEDMRRLQIDRTDGQAQMLLPALLAAIDASALTENAEQARELLLDWVIDPQASPDSAAALIFQQWYMDLAASVFAETLQDVWPRLLRRSYLLNQALDDLILVAYDSPWWRDNRSELIATALESSVAALSIQYGEAVSEWQLSQALHVRVAHELGSAIPLAGQFLNFPDTAWGGGPSTVGRAKYSYANPYVVNAGATVRVVAEMSTPPKVQAVMPGGQSGHFMSRAYSDQFEGWLAGSLHPIAASPEQAGSPALRFLPQ